MKQVSDEVITVQNLRKSFGTKQAVSDLTFSVSRGMIFGLLGPNGAGKSTTIDCLLGTQKQDHGMIRLLAKDPRKDRKTLFQKIGVQFQEAALQKQLRVKEICEITHSLYQDPLDWRQALTDFGMLEKQQAFLATLSGGERQKLCIILAIMGKPELIFLDELTTGLDPSARREVWHYLLLLKERGVTIFLTSHYMDEVERLCDEVMIIKNGRELTRGTVTEIIANCQASNMEEAFLQLIGEEA